MDGLRRWKLEPGTDFSINLSADARLSRTDYTNDQTWNLTPGSNDDPALALQTRYGGLVGQATIIPMWTHNGQSIYEAQSYAQQPRITHFAPGYARVEAFITDALFLIADYRVIDSQIICGSFTIKNDTDNDESLHLDLLGQIIENRKERTLGIVHLSDGTSALSMGMLVGLAPVLVLEGATTDLDNIRISPKIGRTIDIPTGENVTLRWAHAGKQDTQTSLGYSQSALKGDWDEMLQQVRTASSYIPQIGTGDDTSDLVLALGYHRLVQSVLDPTTNFSHEFLVGTRIPERGFSKNGDGSDYISDWRGITSHEMYMSVLALMSFAPEIAQGILQNLVATQKSDGRIDFRTGPTGQESGLLSTPLLARLAWNCYQYTHDEDFLKSIFPALLKFFRRWFKSDVDKEYDGLPEWQDLDQIGYPFLPTFAPTNWGQGLSVNYVETPDMASYLLSEALSLLSIATVLNDSIAESSLRDRIGNLQQTLKTLHRGTHYAYRDRDTNLMTTSESILEDARGDEKHILAYTLDTPARLIVEIRGGTGKAPKATLIIEGKNAKGHTIKEQVAVSDAFDWHYNKGRYTSRHAFSVIDSIHVEGLIRIFKVSVSTVDTSGLDINALLPLWSGGIPDEDAQTVIDLISDDNHFWQVNGVSVVSTQDKQYDPASQNGGGGVWAYFTTLIAEGLIGYDGIEQATDLLTRYLDVQARVFEEDGQLHSGYHSHDAQGLGAKDGLSALPPLHLLVQVAGVHIVSTAKVWVGGMFHFKQPLRIARLGVEVTRSNEMTLVNFPSGHRVELPADADYQLVEDPNPAQQPTLTKSIIVEAPLTSSDRVIIEVEDENDNPDDQS